MKRETTPMTQAGLPAEHGSPRDVTRTQTTTSAVTTSRTPSHLIRLLVLVALVTGLLASGSLTTTATAAGTSTSSLPVPDASWLPLRDQTFYVYDYQRYTPVLHVDTEHATEQGFWFATKADSQSGGRSLLWKYQAYGIQCPSSLFRLRFNPWTNTYGCLLPDNELPNAPVEEEMPYLTQQCREVDGRPWAVGYRGNGEKRCQNQGLYMPRSRMKGYPPETFVCAPWEDSQINGRGVPACVDSSYPWETTPDPLPWVPQPDPCTGAAPGTNAYVAPAGYSPDAVTTNDPGCTGEAPAPNCTADTSWHAACGGPKLLDVLTGFENDPNLNDDGTPKANVATVYSTKEVTATGDAQTVEVTGTATESFTTARGTVTRTFKKRALGRLWKATRSRSVLVTRTATRSVTLSYTAAARTATASRTCGKPTLAEAEACAQAMAADAAIAMANATALSTARFDGEGYAVYQARQAARDAARAAARHCRVTQAMKAPYAHKAYYAAKRVVLKRIAAAR